MGKKKKKKKQRVKPKAVCVFRWEDKIFVSEGYDSKLGQTFYRPIGGSIEFGEQGQDTIIREVMEEIKVVVDDVRYIGLLENIFVFEGKAGHELMLIYDGHFVDEQMYDESLEVQGEDDHQILFTASWKPLSFFHGTSAPPLYPKGLLDMLNRDANA